MPRLNNDEERKELLRGNYPTLVHIVNYSLKNQTLIIVFILKQKWGGGG